MRSAPRAWLWLDGAWQPEGALPLTDRAVRYGMSVFETIGVRDGQPLLVAQHLALLEASARTILFPAGSAGLSGPPQKADGRLGPAVPTNTESFAALRLPELDPRDKGMLRIYITAGDGAPVDAVKNPRIFALFQSSSGDLPDFQTARLHPESVSPFAHGAKTGNYWMQCAAQAAARGDGFDHALVYDTEGCLLSGAMGNVFFVHDGGLCTPSLALAVRPGAIRKWVMQQQSVREVEFSANRLAEADEVFLTNSRLGVMPLRFGTLEPGPIGCALRDRCRREKIIP